MVMGQNLFPVDNSLTSDIILVGHALALRRWHLRKRWTFKAYRKEHTDATLRAIMADKDITVAGRQRKESST